MEYNKDDGSVDLLEMEVPLESDQSADEIFVELQKKHEDYLNPAVISVKQVKRLLEMLLEHCRPKASSAFAEEKAAPAEQRPTERLLDDVEEIDEDLVAEDASDDFDFDTGGNLDDDDQDYTFD